MHAKQRTIGINEKTLNVWRSIRIKRLCLWVVHRFCTKYCVINFWPSNGQLVGNASTGVFCNRYFYSRCALSNDHSCLMISMRLQINERTTESNPYVFGARMSGDSDFSAETRRRQTNTKKRPGTELWKAYKTKHLHPQTGGTKP